MKFVSLLFSPSGRIGRLKYAISSISLSIVTIIIVDIASRHINPYSVSIPIVIATSSAILVMAYIQLVLLKKRIADAGYSKNIVWISLALSIFVGVLSQSVGKVPADIRFLIELFTNIAAAANGCIVIFAWFVKTRPEKNPSHSNTHENNSVKIVQPDLVGSPNIGPNPVPVQVQAQVQSTLLKPNSLLDKFPATAHHHQGDYRFGGKICSEIEYIIAITSAQNNLLNQRSASH